MSEITLSKANASPLTIDKVEMNNMWKSPITEVWEEVLRDQIKEHDEYVIKEIRSRIDVDLEELKKALAYDRDQYNKGYADGKLDAVIHGHWETEVITDCLGNKHCCFACSCCGVSADNEFDYCPNCGAKMDEEEEE